MSKNDSAELGAAIANTAVEQALEGLRNAPAGLRGMLLARMRDMAARGDVMAKEVVDRFDADA